MRLDAWPPRGTRLSRMCSSVGMHKPLRRMRSSCVSRTRMNSEKDADEGTQGCLNVLNWVLLSSEPDAPGAQLRYELNIYANLGYNSNLVCPLFASYCEAATPPGRSQRLTVPSQTSHGIILARTPPVILQNAVALFRAIGILYIGHKILEEH